MRSYLLIIGFALLGLSASHAQVPGITSTVPELNNHKFVLNPLVSSPFIQSTFESRMGVESTINLVLPLPEFLPDSISGLKGSLIFVTVQFHYKQRIKDWIAFYLEGSIAVRSGTELQSLLFEGVNTLFGGETGLLFNISNGPKHQLSGQFSVKNYQATIVNIGQFAEDLLNGVPNPSITQTAPTLNVGLGLNYGVGFSELFGLTASGEISYGESISRGAEQFRFQVGTEAEFNWAAKGVPIGTSLGFLMRSTSNYVYVDSSVAYSIGLKIAYTAMPDFMIGLDLNTSWLPVLSLPDKVTSVGANFNLQYFFN